LCAEVAHGILEYNLANLFVFLYMMSDK